MTRNDTRGSGLGLPAVARRAEAGARGSGLWLWILSLLPFVLLATANSAGYRYGASDLAFYGPAVMRQLDPSLFPRDTPIIDAQARLTFMDETVASISRLTTDDLPALFLGLYLLTLVLLAVGIGAIGASLYQNRWTTIALLAAITLRHAIAKSGTNSLEGYFHPRQLAFALGTLAIAAFLRGRTAVAALALCAAGSLHPTTTLWLAIWLGVATFVSRPHWRKWLGAAIVAAIALAIWTLTLGPLAGRLTLMDAEWLAALDDKDYLFPLRWPVSAWLVNFGYVVLIVWLYSRRVAAGVTTAAETGLAAGCLALAAVFAVAVPLNAARVALAIQLQPARVFWMLDLLAIVYVVWAVAEGAPQSESAAREAGRGSAGDVVARPRRLRDARRVPGTVAVHPGCQRGLGPGRGVGTIDAERQWLAGGSPARRALRHQPADGRGARRVRRRHEGCGDWDVRSRRRVADQGSPEACRGVHPDVSRSAA